MTPRTTAFRWHIALAHSGALMLLTAVACLALWPVYQSVDFIVMAVGGYLLGSMLALLGARWRWPAWLLLVFGATGFLLVGVPLAVPAQMHGWFPSLAGLIDLIAAVALGWKQLVTISIPVGDYQALLVPALILVLTSTVIGLSVALRARRAGFAVLAPTALLVIGIALGPGAPAGGGVTGAVTHPALLGLAFFFGALLWLLLLRAQSQPRIVGRDAPRSSRTREPVGDRRASSVKAFISGAVIVSVAVAAGTAATLALPAAGAREVVRSHMPQPFDPRDYASPLSAFRSYLQPVSEQSTLFEVTGLPAGGRLRLATLDSYDGVVYSVQAPDDSGSAGTEGSGTFTRVPYRLDQSAVIGDETTLSIRVQDYAGVWVPGAGALEQLVFTGATAAERTDAFYYNDASATGAVLGGLQRGDSWQSRSVAPPLIDDLAGAEPGPVVLEPVAVVPDGLRDAVDIAAESSEVPGERLQAALDDLAARGYISHGISADEPVSRSGHGADRIAELFSAVPMLGDAEQYAVAAALLARELGFPARVVLGFVPTSAADAGTVRVTGAHVSAWIEVQTATQGWVTVDPNPPVRDVPAQEPNEPSSVSQPQSVLPPPPLSIQEPADTDPPSVSVDEPPAPLHPLLALLLVVLTAAGWSLLGLLVLTSPLLWITARKLSRRRRRRTAATPAERIVGGWQEFADTAVDFGTVVPRGATRVELAEALRSMPPLVLASLVDRLTFAPEAPTVAESDQVWASATALSRTIAVAHTRRQRLRALFSVRSLEARRGSLRWWERAENLKRSTEGAAS
ncbi:MAG: transglutaminase domain-containing protein [Cryobacterium sp.]